MKIGIKYDLQVLLDKAISLVLHDYNIAYEMVGLSMIKITGRLTPEQRVKINKELKTFGLELIDNHTGNLVSKIKNEITEYVIDNDISDQSNLSCYLSQKLGYSYAHLSSVFTSNTHSTIENFVILKRIDIAKQMMMTGKYTLTEISYSLRFSNVSHLSGQFKKVTGLTPSTFIRIVKNRESIILENTIPLSK